MNYISRRRLLQLGLLTPLVASPFYRQSAAFAECKDGTCCIDPECTNATKITGSASSGNIPGISNFIWPIAGAPNAPYEIGDVFGPRLIRGGYSWHEGIDIKADEGTDVIASCPGFVRIAAACDARFLNSGKIIQIQAYKYDNNNNIIQKYRVSYHHLSELFVNPGDIITQGTVIGKSGCTGASWPHLHLEIRKEDVPQNPYFYLACPTVGTHTVAIQSVTNNTNGTLNVELRVTSPRTKLDINRINVFALDSNNNQIDSMYVDFNETHNCGRINSSNINPQAINSYTYTENIATPNRTVTITPDDFSTTQPNWIVTFKFNGLSSSNTTKIKAQALDCSNTIAENVKTI